MTIQTYARSVALGVAATVASALPVNSQSLDARVFHNPINQRNVESITAGPLSWYHVYHSEKNDTFIGDFAYLELGGPLSLYVSMPHNGKVTFGPSFTFDLSGKSEKKSYVQLDITGEELTLWGNYDGYKLGPLNLRSIDKTFHDRLGHMAVYNGLSLATELIAGREVRKAAQDVYSAAKVLENPTPLGYGFSLYGAIQKHKHGRGGVGKVAKIVADTVTFGLATKIGSWFKPRNKNRRTVAEGTMGSNFVK